MRAPSQAPQPQLTWRDAFNAGPNGAVIHYKADPETAAPVTLDRMFLCDSGGQYLDGTTDVTRTVHFGEPTAHERECFTRVLQCVAPRRPPAALTAEQLQQLLS